jgi:hypothetical protein
MDKSMLSPNETAALTSEENKDLISQIKEAQEVKRSAISGQNNTIGYIWNFSTSHFV